MNYLTTIQKAGMIVRWGTVLIGRWGPGEFGRLVEPEDIVSFAIDNISDEPTSYDEDVLILAGLTPAEYDEVDEYLRRIANHEKFDCDRELRKWRLLLLKQALDDLADDPLYGPIRLTEFGAKFDYPADSPHTVQGRGNKIEPKNYYTRKNFDELRKSHYRWLEDEQRQLKEG
jgi:hypothetical protein